MLGINLMRILCTYVYCVRTYIVYVRILCTYVYCTVSTPLIIKVGALLFDSYIKIHKKTFSESFF